MSDYNELIKALRDEAEYADLVAYMNGIKSISHGSATAEVAGNWAQLFLKAADAIEELQGQIDGWIEPERKALIKSLPHWISVTERLPESGVHVLLSCKCGSCAYVCDGFHTEKYSKPTQFYEDIDADYNEDTDEYYFPEGWWEVIKNWDDYSCVAIEDTITHWMPLPEPPKEET